MIILIGHSASGKTTIEKELYNRGFERIISYTTRPMRQGEIDGYDYHFVSEEYFKEKLQNNYFAEHTNYRGWNYGIAKDDCFDNRIVTVEPVGFRMLKKVPNLNIQSIFIKAPERSRLIRMAKRGDDITEIFRRIFSDQGGFNGIENEVDHVVENLDNEIDQAINNILEIIMIKEF